MMPRETLAARIRDHFDWPLFICTALISVIGVVNLYSATSVYEGTNRAGLYISQVQWLVVGSIFGGIAIAVDYRHLERIAYLLWGFGVISLIAVFFVSNTNASSTVRNAARWIPIGSFQFQPSEFMKLYLVIALAKYLHDDPRPEGRGLKELAIPGILTAVPAFLILRQPDLGTASILVFSFFTIAALTKVRWKSVAMFFGAAGSASYFIYNYGLQGYQKQRIDTFLNPEADVQGTGYHAHHARIAIGDGGLLGTGFGNGTQNQFRFIPDQYTDFPFPVFAEEWGLVGACVLVSLYLFLGVWSVKVASQAKDRFGAILALGAGAIIFWHAFINMGMAAGILPVVGVTLPLFSYGGSSMLTMLMAVSLVMNVSMRRHSGVPTSEQL